MLGAPAAGQASTSGTPAVTGHRALGAAAGSGSTELRRTRGTQQGGAPVSRSSATVTVPFVESAALLSGPAALVVSRVLHSPNVVTVLADLPRWLQRYRSEIHAAVEAVHRAARAYESGVAALEREDVVVSGAVRAHSDQHWTTRQAADHLRLSRRRVQELASAELGGRKVGRQWLFDEVVVREYQRHRRGV